MSAELNMKKVEANMNKPFIDLHTHSTFSELDGMIKIEDYILFAKENNLKALSVTDHGNVNSWINFYLKCKENEIQPILGYEAYVSSKQLDSDDENSKKNYHINIFAKNNNGYKAIIKLVTYANINNFFRKPRVTLDELSKYAGDIVITTACVGSQFSQLILENKLNECKSLLLEYKKIFKDDFYIEYNYHEFDNEKVVLQKLINFSKGLDIKAIITNDSHYLKKEDEIAHKILMCKGEKQTINDTSRFDYSHNYYKTKEEMQEILKEFDINIDSCIDNIYEIIDKCNVEIEFGNYIFPEYPTPNGEGQMQYLVDGVKKGILKRYGRANKEILDRVKYELGVIKNMGFAGYFNVVADYIKWAKDNNIRIGTARGSAGGSLVVYLLEITDIDPLKFGLLFERFLNPDRVSNPDIDSDVDSNERQSLLNYLFDKYGVYSATQISTKGYLKGKSAIKTVASRLGLDFNKYNKLLSQIKDPTIDSVDKVVEYSEKIQELYNSDDEVKKVIDTAKKIEGNIQSTGLHAGGIIICHKDISDICPIVRTKDGYATAWSDKIVEKLGLIKYDILGLSNLSTISNCLGRINNE